MKLASSAGRRGAFLAGMAVLLQPAGAADVAPGTLSVADTIELQRVVRNGLESPVVHDPTGRRAALVFMRGDLGSDTVSYSLLVLELKRVRAALRAKVPERALELAPAAVFRSASNQPAIDAVRWSPDGEALTFIGEQPGEAAQLYRLAVASGRIERLTSAGSSVIAYDANAAGIIYSVRASRRSDWFDAAEQGYVVLGHERLTELMNPDSSEWDWLPHFETYAVQHRSGETVHVARQDLPQMPATLRYWLSPDGRYAIAQRRLDAIPARWADFAGSDGYRLTPTEPGDVARHGFATQLVLVDCRDGTVVSLLDAPTAQTLRHYLVRPAVAWAADSRSAIVSGSFVGNLPGIVAEERSRRLTQPALTEVQVPSRRATVIHYFDPAAPDSTSLTVEGLKRSDNDARFTVELSARALGTADEVFEVAAPVVELAFEREAGRWRQASNRRTGRGRGRGRGRAAPTGIFLREDMNQPPLLVARNHRSGERVIFDPNPQLRHLTLPRWSTFEWVSRDGQRWRAGLLVPPRAAGQRLPLVIQTHGFTTTRFLADGSFSTAFAAQALASHGFAVLQMPDDPTTATSEDAAVAAREGEKHLAAYEAAIDVLAQRGLVDRERVGLVGFSRTCYHVKYAMAFSRYPLRAVVAADGVDMGYAQYLAWMQGMDPAWPRTFELRNGGNPFVSGIGTWAQKAPQFNLRNVRAALRTEILDHTNTILGWEMHVALRSLGVPAELVVYKDARHELFKPSQRRTSLQGTVDWMRFWMKGEEDPDPAKSSQYARWRVMREHMPPAP